jgi:hypothetical protein
MDRNFPSLRVKPRPFNFPQDALDKYQSLDVNVGPTIQKAVRSNPLRVFDGLIQFIRNSSR